MTPTSSSSSCPARATATACPIASGSGRPRIEIDRPRQDLSRRPDLRPLGLRQVVAGQGRTACRGWRKNVLPVYVEATAAETEARLLRRPAQGVPRACPQLRAGRRSRGCCGEAACYARAAEGAAGPRPVRAVALRPARRARPGAGRRSAAVRRRARPGDRHGPRRLLDGGDPVHARALEIRLLEGENSAAVDLFDPRTPARCWRRSAAPTALCPRRPRDHVPRRTAPSSTRRSRASPRTARSSRCGWPSSPRWSRESPGPRRPCARSAAPRASA